MLCISLTSFVFVRSTPPSPHHLPSFKTDFINIVINMFLWRTVLQNIKYAENNYFDVSSAVRNILMVQETTYSDSIYSSNGA
jgi:hypothetical protein